MRKKKGRTPTARFLDVGGNPGDIASCPTCEHLLKHDTDGNGHLVEVCWFCDWVAKLEQRRAQFAAHHAVKVKVA